MLFVKNRLHFHGTFDLATGLHKLFKELHLLLEAANA